MEFINLFVFNALRDLHLPTLPYVGKWTGQPGAVCLDVGTSFSGAPSCTYCISKIQENHVLTYKGEVNYNACQKEISTKYACW